MMKTLYLSDLDGTLLRSDQHTSAYTDSVINRLAERGAFFSYATARSFSTARLTTGFSASLPVIVHNGVCVVDSSTGKTLYSWKFSDEEKEEILSAFLREGFSPISYAVIDGKNRFSYLREKSSKGQWEFILMRQGDGRAREVNAERALLDGEVFYFSCIHEREKLLAVMQRLQEKFRCVHSRDIYSGEWWLEVAPRGASKADAARVVQKMLGCDRLVCFGDNLNDLPMFEIADEKYAVAGAEEALKKLATGIIPSNDEDGVARWLEEHVLNGKNGA